MKIYLQRFWQNESGQALTEYALILAVVAIAVVAAMTIFREQLVEVFTGIGEALGGASGDESSS